MEIDFRFPKKDGRTKIVSVILEAYMASEGGAFGAVYTSRLEEREIFEFVSPVSFVPLPLWGGAKGRRDVTEFFGEWLGEKRVHESDIASIDRYRKPSNPDSLTRRTVRKSDRIVDGIFGTKK